MISAIVSCMNRLDPLRISLKSWCDFELISEIVVVDWSSDSPITLSDLPKSNKLKIVRVENQKEFSLSKSLNVGYDFVSEKNDILCKIDTDYVLVNTKIFIDIFTHHIFDGKKIRRPVFFTGHWFFDESLSGFLLMNKKDFCYYNENMSGWGYEDEDLHTRLIHNNMKHIIIPGLHQYIYHIPHDDDLRVANYNIKNKKQSSDNNKKLHDIKYKRTDRKYDILIEDDIIIVKDIGELCIID